MDAAKCPSCGATGKGLVCTYCGSRIRDSVDETLALAEYHQLLKDESGETLTKLLRHGYLPANEKGLIETGFVCLPFLDEELHSDEGEAAAKRLETVISRLRVSGGSEQAEKAVTEFNTRLSRYRTDVNRSIRIGCIILGLSVLLIVALVLWLIYG